MTIHLKNLSYFFSFKQKILLSNLVKKKEKKQENKGKDPPQRYTMILQTCEHKIVANCIIISNGKHRDSSCDCFICIDYVEPF